MIALKGNRYPTLAAGLRDYRGLTKRPTRVRGQRGYALTHHGPPTTRTLLWRERGAVYTLGSATPKTVSLARLRATATGLDRLEGAHLGASEDPDYQAEALAVITERTASAFVSWPARCTNADGSPASDRAGYTNAYLVPRQGDAFSIAPPSPWSGSIAGTVGPGAVTMDLRAAGTFDGLPCDTGPLRLTLSPTK